MWLPPHRSNAALTFGVCTNKQRRVSQSVVGTCPRWGPKQLLKGTVGLWEVEAGERHLEMVLERCVGRQHRQLRVHLRHLPRKHVERV